MTEKGKGEYGLRGSKVPRATQRVATGPHPIGAPKAQIQDRTPIQPIVIHVPHDSSSRQGSKTPSSRGLDSWSLFGAVVIAVVLSSSISVYVASEFLKEYSGRIERLDKKVEELDKKVQSLDTQTTRIEAQVENFQ